MELLAFDINGLVDTVIRIGCVALGLGLVIFFHELGHFAVAKWCGVFVEKFSIGFGPVLWSIKRGDTEYALSLIPVGGFVKMLGQDDMDPSQLTAEEIALDQKSYSAKTVPQRMGIISAGVIMNVITGLIFFAIAFKFGVETAPATVGEVLISRPAWQRGLQTGDTVTRINDRTIETFSDILRGTTLSRGDIRLGGVHGDGKTFEVTIAPNSEGKRRLIGVAPAHSLNVMAYGKESKWTVLPGSPAAAFGDTFSDKSTISAVNG